MFNILTAFATKQYGDSDEGLNFLDTLKKRVRSFRAAGLGDENFEDQLYSPNRDNFFSRIWELNLAECLQRSGLEISSKPVGPDFMARINGKNVWFEAISPRPEGLPEDYCYPFDNENTIRCYDVPYKEILLRITSAMNDKAKKFNLYIKNGIIDKDDLNIIAVDVTQLGLHADFGISQIPTIIEATYPVGPLTLTIDPNSMETLDSSLSYRPYIQKKAQERTAKIPTETFLSGAYKHISAAISGFGAIQETQFTLVHNISAKNILQPNKLKVDKEYIPTHKENILSLVNIKYYQ